jgi:hypothetical protein
MRLRPDNPHLAKAITIHPKALRQPTDTNMLKSVASNHKLGKGDTHIMKGRWSGMPMYALTLEERRTCPSSCQQWDNCYGNNMAFAHRFDHTSPRFYEALSDELDLLTRKHKQGVVVRLHVLGDFFDEQYVRWWNEQTTKYPRLYVFGFTAHTLTSDVGQRIKTWNDTSHKRVWVRFSNSGDHPLAANVGTDTPGVTCPEQTGQTRSCLTCGLCWTAERPINFLEH